MRWLTDHPGRSVFRLDLERTHGSPIAWGKVSVITQFYAESPFQPLTAEVPLFVRQAFGPRHLFVLQADSVYVAGIAVAGYSTNIRIDSAGNVELPPIIANEIRIWGIAKTLEHLLPLWPEHTVSIAGSATGVRVREVPQLIGPDYTFNFEASRWKLQLERPIRIRSLETGLQRESDLIFVGFQSGAITWFVPRETQPTRTFTVREPDATYHFTVDPRPGYPFTFEAIEPLK